MTEPRPRLHCPTCGADLGPARPMPAEWNPVCQHPDPADPFHGVPDPDQLFHPDRSRIALHEEIVRLLHDADDQP